MVMVPCDKASLLSYLSSGVLIVTLLPILIIYCYTLIVLVYGSIQWLEVMVILYLV